MKRLVYDGFVVESLSGLRRGNLELARAEDRPAVTTSVRAF
jgi:hypothetical protein